MNLKLKRLVRTPHSEQYALFDLDQPDAAGAPRTIGKLDLHYTAEGMYGTLLLWDAAVRALRPAVRRAFVHALLREIAQPMGVPNEYVIEFFAPSLDQYEVFHNVDMDEEEAAIPAVDAGLLDDDADAPQTPDDLDDFDVSLDSAVDGDDGLALHAAADDEERLDPLPPSLSEPPPVRRFAPRPPGAS